MRPTLSVIGNLRTFCGDYGLYSPQTGLSTRKIKEKRQQHPSERIKDGLVGYNRLSRTKAAKVCFVNSRSAVRIRVSASSYNLSVDRSPCCFRLAAIDTQPSAERQDEHRQPPLFCLHLGGGIPRISLPSPGHPHRQNLPIVTSTLQSPLVHYAYSASSYRPVLCDDLIAPAPHDAVFPTP